MRGHILVDELTELETSHTMLHHQSSALASLVDALQSEVEGLTRKWQTERRTRLALERTMDTRPNGAASEQKWGAFTWGVSLPFLLDASHREPDQSAAAAVAPPSSASAPNLSCDALIETSTRSAEEAGAGCSPAAPAAALAAAPPAAARGASHGLSGLSLEPIQALYGQLSGSRTSRLPGLAQLKVRVHRIGEGLPYNATARYSVASAPLHRPTYVGPSFSVPVGGRCSAWGLASKTKLTLNQTMYFYTVLGSFDLS